FVPDYRTHSYLDAFHLRNPGAALNDGPLYKLPFGAIFPNSISAPAIGVAMGALAAFREQSQARANLRDGSRLAEDPIMQLRLAGRARDPRPCRQQSGARRRRVRPLRIRPAADGYPVLAAGFVRG